jgi:hypothetical protein
MPDGALSTTFLHRPDQKLAMLKLGRRTNESRFGWEYKVGSATLAPYTLLPVIVDAVDDHNSYFKFNLNHITLYCLLTGGDSSWVKSHYTHAFSVLRKTTAGHGNAFFNLIERAVSGTPSPDRDRETRRLLDEWLDRPVRDEWVDLRDELMSCREDDRACDPISIAQRVRTDFLWQRSPFLLYGGGSGRIESAGIDYILPYWMARYYGVIAE